MMMYNNLCAITLLFLFTVRNNVATECFYDDMVDLWDGIKIGENIVKDSISYPPSCYFKNGTTYGCLCCAKECIPKCCPVYTIATEKGCQYTTFDLSVPIYRGTEEVGRSNFYYKYRLNCRPTIMLDRVVTPAYRHHIQEDGTLYLPAYNEYQKKVDYCFEYLSTAHSKPRPIVVTCVKPRNIPAYVTYGKLFYFELIEINILRCRAF